MVKVHNRIWVRRQEIHAPAYEGVSWDGPLAIRHTTNISNCRRLPETAPNLLWIFVVDTLKVPTNDSFHLLPLLRSPIHGLSTGEKSPSKQGKRCHMGDEKQGKGDDRRDGFLHDRGES